MLSRDLESLSDWIDRYIADPDQRVPLVNFVNMLVNDALAYELMIAPLEARLDPSRLPENVVLLDKRRGTAR